MNETASGGRGIGITEFLHGHAEAPITVLFALITQLGDVWFLFLVGGVLYVAGDYLPRWGIDRRRGLFVLALVLTYLSLVGLLKHVFVLPRPPGATQPPSLSWVPAAFELVFVDITTAEGPGFPSGHALGTTMIWGGLALVLDRRTVAQRAAVAGAVVVLVSVARLVLGVHYFVDVVVGAAVGLVALAALYWVTERGTDPERVLLVAVALGVGGLLVSVTFDSVAAVGGAVGGWVVWRGIADSTPAHPTSEWEVLAGFGALCLAAALFGLLYAFEPPHVATFVGSAVAVGTAVGAPLLGERLV